MKHAFSLLLLLISFVSPVAAQDNLCGAVPSLPTSGETSESIKGQLQGQANLLTKYVGNAQLGGQIEAARKTLYQSSDKFFAAQKDAYLAYLFCLALTQDKSLSSLDKIKAISEFSKPAPTKIPGTIRQIANNYLYDNNTTWAFHAPAGAVVEAIGLNCPAIVIAGGQRFTISDNFKVPVPGFPDQQVPVTITLEPGIRAALPSAAPPSLKRPKPQTPGQPGAANSEPCHGKFLVTAAD